MSSFNRGLAKMLTLKSEISGAKRFRITIVEMKAKLGFTWHLSIYVIGTLFMQESLC